MIFPYFSWPLFANHQTKRWPFQKPKLRFKDLRWTFFNALTLGQERWQSKNRRKNSDHQGATTKIWNLDLCVSCFDFPRFFHETPEVVGSFCHDFQWHVACCGFAMTRHVRKRGHRSFGELFVGVHSVAGRFAECSSHLRVQHAWLVGSTGTLLPCVRT